MNDTLMAVAMEAIAGLDLTSADGKAGIRNLLQQLESQAPGTIEPHTAGLLLRRVGFPPAP